MRLSDGFVVGGRYRIETLLASGSKFRVYAATTDEDGPGRVVVKVARHEGLGSLSGLHVGRSRVEQAWRVSCTLHQLATSAVPLPIELVHMYPGDPDVRHVAVVDKKLVRSEPYAVLELANGEPLSHVVQNERIDEERALLLALRTVLLYRVSLGAGWLQTDFSASNYMVDAAGENLSLVDPTGVDRAQLLGEGDPVWRTFGTESRPVIERCASGEQVPPALGRLLVSLFGGTSAPSWAVDAEDRPRWERLLASRRVPREFHTMLLGALGYTDVFDASPEHVENRLRALVRAKPARVYAHVSKQSDTPYLIAAGERVAERFEVLGPLGQGGRGFVYRARDSRSDVAVLIKANKYQYDAGSAFALELPTRRLELEHEFSILRTFASRTGMLPQPVALVRDRGRGAWFDLAPSLAEHEPYLVMEHIKGIPLLDLLPAPLEGQAGYWKPNNRLRPAFALRLIAQIADLLRTFHALGYLVQDLKPENILFDPSSENIYLVDFAAVCPRRPDGMLDRDSVAFGTQTHGFAAPEFAALWEACDDRFDIYSLGATAFHLLTGMNPERLAAEQGTEYPELPLGALEHLPAAVLEVVRRCLAPVEQRFRTADEAFIAAERARLQLSRSRPLDVQGLDVAYGQDGVRLGWHLPVDPRVERVRIVRVEGSDERIVFDGEACTGWTDTTEAVGDRSYRVETGLIRRGATLHSRGRVVRTEAHPPPILFEATPWFGCTRVRVALAAHAVDAVVRWAWDAPPTAPDEGYALDVTPDTWVEHAPVGAGELHYAAFARYADDAHSAPRFGAARVCPELGAIDGFEASQSVGAVTLSWRTDDARWRVRVLDGSGTVRWLSAEFGTGAQQAMDTDVRPGERVTYEWVATDDDVSSEPAYRVALHRWPVPPDVQVSVGAAEATLQARDVDPRFNAFEVHRVTAAGSERLAVASAFPIEVKVPSDTLVSLVVQCQVDGRSAGPGLHVELVVPPVDPALSLVAIDPLLPTRVRVGFPSTARAWTGGYRLEVTEAKMNVLTWEGPVEAFGDEALAREIEGTATEPGEVRDWAVRLCSAAGDVLAVRLASVVALERLPAPTLVPALAAVVVDPAGVSPYRLRVWVEGDEAHAEESGPHDGPWRVEHASGTRVCVAWRRVVDGVDMPWSEVSAATTLALPEPPTHVVAIRTEDGVRVSWTPASPDAVSVVVAVPDRLVFVGDGTTCMDVAPGGAERYTVATRRGALDSPPVASPTIARRAGSGMLAPLAAAAPLADSPVRLLQVVALSARQSVVELATPGPPRWIGIVRAGRKGPDPRAIEGLADRWAPGANVLALTVSTGGRTLLPWSGTDTIGVFEAEWDDGTLSWTAVAPFIEPVRGRLLGAMGEEDGGIALFAPRRDALPTELRVVAIRADGQLSRRSHTAAGGVARVPAPVSDGVGARLCGVALETPQPATVLVPMTSRDDLPALDGLIWRDAAYGAVLSASRALSAHWGAPIVSQVVGQTSVFNALKQAEPVAWMARVDDLTARGVARIALEVRTMNGVVSRVFRVRLGEPVAWATFGRVVVEWVSSELAPVEDPLRAFGWGL